MSVTRGAIARIAEDGQQTDDFKPTLQVLGIKCMAAGNAERYRLMVSDGENYQACMLATHQNDLIISKQIQQLSLLRLEEFLLNNVKGKRLIIALSVSAVGGGPVDKVGNPQSITANTEDEVPQDVKPNPAPVMQGGYGQGNNYAATANNTGYRAGGASNSGSGGGGGGSRGYGNQSSSNPYLNRVGGNSGGGMGSYGRNDGPMAREDGNMNFKPIHALNPYDNRWTIKARVSQKNEIRRWQNERGDGHLFSAHLIDAEGSEIKATFFKEACDLFEPMLHEGKVYTFSGGKVKVINNQKYAIGNTQQELTFDEHSEIQEVAEDKGISSHAFNFTPIADLQDVEVGQTTDVIGVVTNAEDMTTIVTKAGKDCEKMNLTIVDTGSTEVRLTAWGDKAKALDGKLQNGAIVAFLKSKVGDFGGRSLSTGFSGAVVIEPDTPETAELRTWWQTVGSSASNSFQTLSDGSGGGGGKVDDKFESRGTISAIKNNNLGYGEKADFLSFKATVTFIKHDQDSGPWYTACTTKDCKKKVTEQPDGGWHCDKCNKTMEDCQRRYILSVICSDHTGQTWMTAFDDSATPLLGGRSAGELWQMKENDQGLAFEQIFQEALWQEVVMKARVKCEQVRDEQRVKVSILGFKPVDFKRESADLIKAIAAF